MCARLREGKSQKCAFSLRYAGRVAIEFFGNIAKSNSLQCSHVRIQPNHGANIEAGLNILRARRAVRTLRAPPSAAGIHLVTVDAHILDADDVRWLTSSSQQLTIKAFDETQLRGSHASGSRPAQH